MCGIAGYRGRKFLDNRNIKKCLGLMKQRGPDFSSSLLLKSKNENKIYFLHSRLAIIDIDSRSNQPFKTAGNVLSFNGEIYNYLELKVGLKKKGYSFQGKSDTEVFSKLLDHEGIKAVEKCEGMFAFSWMDKFGNLFLGRDRFGEKPLYYFFDSNGDLYFGSEIKFIFALLGKKTPVNIKHLKRYLVNGYKSLYKTEEVFFEGIKELSPGNILKIDKSGQIKKNSFWNPKFKEDNQISYNEAVLETKERLINSVKLRLRADVPVAFCLSGGIDSNALIGIAKRVLGYDVHGFTIMNTDKRYEERDMIDIAVKELNLNHTEVSIDKSNFLNNLRTLIRYHDAPVFTITYYAQWNLMKMISEQGYKVSISGTAADELFSGYFDHHNAYLAMMYFEDRDRYEQAYFEWKKIVSPIVRNPYLKDPMYFVKDKSSRDHIYLDSNIFSEFLVNPFHEEFEETHYTDRLLRNRMANELFEESVPVILHEDDLNSMFYSIENRTPYLDSQLFEWSQLIPTKHLIKNGRAKSILRESVRGIVSDSILDNPRKVGFNVPIMDYLKPDDPFVKEELLKESPVFEIIKYDLIKKLLKKKTLPNSQSKFLFNFINTKMFLEEFS